MGTVDVNGVTSLDGRLKCNRRITAIVFVVAVMIGVRAPLRLDVNGVRMFKMMLSINMMTMMMKS